MPKIWHLYREKDSRDSALVKRNAYPRKVTHTQKMMLRKWHCYREKGDQEYSENDDIETELVQRKSCPKEATHTQR